MIKRFLSSYAWLLTSQLKTGLYAWATLVGMIAGLKALPPILLAISSLTAMLAIALSVYIYNDIMDVELDKINAEAGNPHQIKRPLVTGKASMRDAKIFVLALIFIGLSIALSVNLGFAFLLALYLGLGILYSTPPIHLKDRFLFKQLTISIGQAISSLAGGAAVGLISNPVIYAAALFFTLTFGVVPVTDLRDIYGDEKIGRKTFPIVIGPEATMKVAMVVVTATLFASVASYSWIGFNSAFLILMFASLFILLLSMINIYRNVNDVNLINNMIRRVLRPLFIILQISILIGLVSL